MADAAAPPPIEDLEDALERNSDDPDEANPENEYDDVSEVGSELGAGLDKMAEDLDTLKANFVFVKAKAREAEILRQGRDNYSDDFLLRRNLELKRQLQEATWDRGVAATEALSVIRSRKAEAQVIDNAACLHLHGG